MAWQTPKTDWKETYSSKGVYEGDFFEAADYQRIKGNLIVLRELADGVYSASVVYPNLPDITDESYSYAADIDALEKSLDALVSDGRFNPGIPDRKAWGGNSPAPRSDDLNRIENSCLMLYNMFNGALAIRPKLSFQMGGSEF